MADPKTATELIHVAWVLKHKPKTLSEVVGNRETVEEFKKWIKSWDEGPPKKRAAFLFGPPGVGKTVTVESLSKDLDVELVEKNASDYRSQDAVKKFAGLASQYATLSGKKRLILLDEMDGITGTEDRGGVQAITEIIKTSTSPIALTANNPYDPRFAKLRSYCLMLEFKKVSARDVVAHLSRICAREGIKADEEALKFIAQRSEGDVRSAVNDLQAMAQGKKTITYEDVSWLAYRDRKDVIFSVLRLILYSKTCDGAKDAVDMADVDTDMLFEWIYENIPYHYNDPRDLAQAMNALSTADVYRGQIRRTQDWKLTRYVIDFMSAGVAMSRQHSKPGGWVPFRFPERIKWLSATRAERQMKTAIGGKVKKKCHISAFRAVKEFIPYLRIIFKNNADMAMETAKWLGLDSDMVEYLAGTKRQGEAILKKLEQKGTGTEKEKNRVLSA